MNRVKTAASVVIILAMPALLSAGLIKPGKWQHTVEKATIGANGVEKALPILVETCVTPEQAERTGPPPQPKDSQCTVSDYKVDGKTATWSIACPDKVTGSGSMKYADESYEGTMRMDTADGHSTLQIFRGKRVGECDNK